MKRWRSHRHFWAFNAGLSIVVLLAGAFVCSAWLPERLFGRGVARVGFAPGGLEWVHHDGVDRPRPFATYTDLPWEEPSWCWRWHSRRFTGGSAAFVPLWVPLLPAFILTGLTWRHGRTFAPGLCPACGYNLTGSPVVRCPECGNKPHP